jgi:carbamoyl-phosphate synthase small subunit
MEGADTRKIARHIYDKGEMKGIISPAGKPGKYKFAISSPGISDVSVKKIKTVNIARPHVTIGILDLGASKSFLNLLRTYKTRIILFPFDTTPGKIIKAGINGLVISNGPEDEKQLPRVAETAQTLRGRLPLLGVSSGCVVLGLSLGAKLKRLKTGHRGANYPVVPKDSFKGMITSQNHRLAIDETSKMKKTDVTMVNLNDGTAEAIFSRDFKISGIQYLTPCSRVFDEFIRTCMEK